MIYISTILITFFISVLSSILTKRAGLVDKPDGVRKIHVGDISLGGGISIYISLLVILFFYPNTFISLPSNFFYIYLISSLIFIFGIIDDYRSLSVSIRILLQIFSVSLVIYITGLYVDNLGNLFGTGDIILGKYIGIPLTIFMVVGVCNAFNMFDGMDGLITMVSIVSVTSVCILTLLLQKGVVLSLVPTLILFVFLLFNLGFFGKSLKMFLGDGGSLFLGFLLVWLLVILSQDDIAIFKPVVALWLVPLPIIDTLTTSIIRIIKGKNIMKPDRNHIHYLILDSGNSKWKTLIFLLSLSIICAIIAIFSVIHSIPEYYIFYAFIIFWLFYSILLIYSMRDKNK